MIERDYSAYRELVRGLRHWRDSLNARIVVVADLLEETRWWQVRRRRRLRAELRGLVAERNRIAFRISGFLSLGGEPDP